MSGKHGYRVMRMTANRLQSGPCQCHDIRMALNGARQADQEHAVALVQMWTGYLRTPPPERG